MFHRRVVTAAGLLLLLLAFTGVGAMADKTPPAPMAPTFSPTQPRYFFTVDLDPRYQVVGIGELTGEEAAKANCYRFLYNPNGRLRQIEYLRAGDPQPDPLFQVERIDFEYQPGTERRWYRDAQGKPVACISGNKGEELTLNPAGYPTDVANLDENGAPMRDDSGVVHYVRTLDASGRIAVGRRVTQPGSFITDNDGYFETRSAYDNLDHRIEYGNFDASGQALNDADGVAMIRTTYTIYPDSIQSVESYFDSSGLAVAEKSTGAHQCERITDTRGLLLSKAYFDTTGAPTVDNDERIHESRYEYDERGNRLSEEYFDPDGKPCNLRREGYARVTYLYDDKNRVIEKAFFGDDGAPQVVTALGAAVVRQDYDDHNMIVRQQFFDGQGQPVINTRYGAPAIRIEVNGDTTTVRLCTADDKPAVNAVYGYTAFSYKTATDKELTKSNHYYDRYDRPISYFPRVSVINPHLYQLKKNPVMKYSARCGAAAAGFGALLAAILALQKSSYTKRRKVYVPTPGKRLLALLAQFAMAEGAFRFFLTVYWWWLEHQYVRMGHGVQILEAALIIYFLHRLYRLHLTMRVLNIGRDELHRILRDFFIQSGLNPEWDEARQTYIMPSLRVQVRYYARKYHGYLCLRSQGRPGRQLARNLARHMRAQADAIQGPARSRAIALYYPSVAFCYFLFSGTAFYTLWQLVKPS
jgi:YD repeat-containing protein